MTIPEDVERLRELAGSDRIPIEKLRTMQSGILDLNAEVRNVLGPGQGFVHGIGGCAAELGDRLNAALAAAQELESAILDAADALEHGG